MLGGIWVILRRIGKKIPAERRTLEIRKWWQKIGIQIPWNSVSIGKLTISINRFDKIQLKNQHSRKNRHCSVWTKIKHSSDLADGHVSTSYLATYLMDVRKWNIIALKDRHACQKVVSINRLLRGTTTNALVSNIKTIFLNIDTNLSSDWLLLLGIS